ncbi:MAG: helix-turn-helix transcriptional regulator [Candidatus Omnitrophica bacterium]|nr:helix-turn-helix transcriptional regulator [Candidatus Omnitrophota bacterium]
MKGLGSRVKALRKEKRFTLIDVCQKTGIDQATLSRIENEKMTGTIHSHMKIAQVLGVRLPDLYEDVVSKIEEEKDPAIKEKMTETFSRSDGAVAEILASGILQRKMMPVRLKIKGKGQTDKETYALGSERFVYVLKGALQAVVGNDRKKAKQGESLYFNAALPHHFENPLKTEAACLSVVSPVSVS